MDRYDKWNGTEGDQATGWYKKPLNKLSQQINEQCGFVITPRINYGPCGRFAKIFFEEWNTRFEDKCAIGFVMPPAGTNCLHVMIKLADDIYYDGGNGVMTKHQLMQQVNPGTWIDEMINMDLSLLEERSHGFDRSYPECANYSDLATRNMICNNLDKLKEQDVHATMGSFVPGQRPYRILNQLRDHINSCYGTKITPRINLGPNGPLTKIFYEQWNQRFKEKVKIAFVMCPGDNCQQAAIRFTDGNYFDAGHGVSTEEELLDKLGPYDQVIEIPDSPDPVLLAKRTGIHKVKYPECPIYTDSLAVSVVAKCLDEMKSQS